MMPTVRIGIEGALAPNPYLSRLDEATGVIALWDRHLAAAFRHCIVSADGAGEHAVLALGARHASGGHPLSVVVGWTLAQSGSEGIRSRFLAGALQRGGWDVLVRGDVALARRAMTEESPAARMPDGCERHVSGRFVLGGADWSLNDLCEPPFLASMRDFCRAQRLRPSEECIRGLYERGLTLAYTSAYADSIHGAVVIGPAAHAPGIEELRRVARIAGIHMDADAPRAWPGRD